MDNGLRRAKALSMYLDTITLAIEQAAAIPDLKQRRTYIQSTLFYWMGIMFDEGAVYAADIETALSAMKAINSKLKESVESYKDMNKSLAKRISSER